MRIQSLISISGSDSVSKIFWPMSCALACCQSTFFIAVGDGLRGFRSLGCPLEFTRDAFPMPELVKQREMHTSNPKTSFTRTGGFAVG